SAREERLKEAREAQRRSEQHFRSLIENAVDIITVLDREGRVRYASPSVKRALGYAPDALIGRPLAELVQPEDAAAFASSFAAATAGAGNTAAADFRIGHQEGGWRLVEATFTNLLEDPAVAGVVLNARDVTEERRAHELARE